MFGSPEPFATPTSFSINALVGGVPTSISKLLSLGFTMIVTGTFNPVKGCVISLIFVTTWNMLTPVGPRAGPIGGPPLAFPPSTKASTTIGFSLNLFTTPDAVHSVRTQRFL